MADVADDMETARVIIKKYIRLGVRFIVGKDVYAEWMKNDIAAALAAEREACARIADSFACGACGMDGKAGKAIRARSHKEQQQ
jgi:hypothetical protein